MRNESCRRVLHSCIVQAACERIGQRAGSKSIYPREGPSSKARWRGGRKSKYGGVEDNSFEREDAFHRGAPVLSEMPAGRIGYGVTIQ